MFDKVLSDRKVPDICFMWVFLQHVCVCVCVCVCVHICTTHWNIRTESFFVCVVFFCACAYTGIAVAVSHDEVEGGTGLAPVLIDGAAAVLEHLLAQVCTLLRLLLKQQVPKLHTNTHT